MRAWWLMVVRVGLEWIESVSVKRIRRWRWVVVAIGGGLWW